MEHTSLKVKRNETANNSLTHQSRTEARAQPVSLEGWQANAHALGIVSQQSETSQPQGCAQQPLEQAMKVDVEGAAELVHHAHSPPISHLNPNGGRGSRPWARQLQTRLQIMTSAADMKIKARKVLLSPARDPLRPCSMTEY